MDIRTGMDGLKSLLGVGQTQAPSSQAAKSGAAQQSTSATSDRATLSNAASQMAQADDGVRMDKVVSIQAALAAGTYRVSASSVASRMVDAMLAGR